MQTYRYTASDETRLTNDTLVLPVSPGWGLVSKLRNDEARLGGPGDEMRSPGFPANSPKE